jgi:tetratricopeptide (TPR) repeat protein
MANPFPFNYWEDIAEDDWETKIVDWFCANYNDDAKWIMAQLLDHVFQVSRNVSAPDYRLDKVMQLGKALQNHIPPSSIFDAREGHHRRILTLLQLGLPLRSARLFMVPEISKDNLLNLDGYSMLSLGIKYYAAGDYVTSTRLLERVASECALAKYVIGQDYRRRNRFEPARMWLDQCIERLKGWGNHSCPFNRGQNIICSKPLIEAEAFRAKGVVFRRQGSREEAKDSFSQALSAVEEAISTISDDDELLAHYRVKADVCYSYGYCLYEERDYEKAESLFKTAIDALNYANEDWDAPYTRLAVIQLCRGQRDLAVETFINAYTICNDTPIEQNREAPLGKALCALGMQVIDICYPGRGIVAISDSMEDLENALNLAPNLDFGPLECHKEDAEHLLIDELRKADELVNQFINRLEEAIIEVEPTSSPLNENPRILFLGASPNDQKQIRLVDEVNAIQEGLRQARYGSRFEFYQRLNVDFSQLSASILNHNPHIVHISAHVDEEGNIILVDGYGCSEVIPPDRLGTLLSQFKNYIRCVVLAGCNSERTAKVIKEIQPYVEPIVAMSRPVRDSVCIDFSRQFYMALGSGRRVQSAFDIGRAAMDHPEWKTLANLFWQWNNPRRIRFV